MKEFTVPAISADTQEEPQAVCRHLAWLKSLMGPPILIGTAGKLGDDLMHGTNSTGQRFASIPAFTTPDGGKTIGQTKRQYSKVLEFAAGNLSAESFNEPMDLLLQSQRRTVPLYSEY